MKYTSLFRAINVDMLNKELYEKFINFASKSKSVQKKEDRLNIVNRSNSLVLFQIDVFLHYLLQILGIIIRIMLFPYGVYI